MTGQNDLDRILSKIPEIAKAVNEFQSPELQAKAFDALMKAAGLAADENVASGNQAEPMPQASQPTPKTVKSKGKGSPKKSGDSQKDNAKARKASEGYKIIDIDLMPNGKQSLKEFIADKKPKGDPQTYACIIYYLQNIVGMEGVDMNHVYTCYKALNLKVPNIVSGLNNTRGRYGWIQKVGAGTFGLTRIGENFVEHELPASPASENK